LGESKAEQAGEKLKPPFGAVQWYSDFFKLCERIKIDRVDVQFLRTHEIASKGNENKVVNGLKFLCLIKEDGSATEKMKSLGVVGEGFQKSLQAIVREAYSVLFNAFKNDLEKAKPQDVINSLRGKPYEMAPSTAKLGAQVFVFLAQKAEIPLSQEIVDELEVSQERKKVTHFERKPRPHKEDEEESPQKQLPQEAIARLILRGTGHVDIKDKDDFEIAKAYWKVLSKKLGIAEGDKC
jgi:hypothetical protein